MGKLESTIKSEIERLAKGEIRKFSVPLGRDVRSIRITLSKLRRTVLLLERFMAGQRRELEKKKVPLEATTEELKKSRFSPRLIKSLRKKLGISQKELAILIGITAGAVASWESGKFVPKEKKKGMMVALRKLGRRGVRKMLEEKAVE